MLHRVQGPKKVHSTIEKELAELATCSACVTQGAAVRLLVELYTATSNRNSFTHFRGFSPRQVSPTGIGTSPQVCTKERIIEKC